MDPVAVDLDPLRHRPRLGDILRYEKLGQVPCYRRFLFVLVGLAAAVAALVFVLCFSGASQILAETPMLAIVAGTYAAFAAIAFVWFTIEIGRRSSIAYFAWANGWAYADTLERTGRTGSAFTRVQRGRERAVVSSDDPRMPFELGRHYSVTRGPDQMATIQRPFAFIELPLPTSVPNIVLRNRGRSIIPSLGFSRGNARLELEGDFASRFTLFVPTGYEQDALYIFTPDLMARVVDLGSAAEVELNGNRLYVYLPHRTRFDRPDTMTAVLVLAEEFHRRFAIRTARYADGLIDPPTARAGGRIGLHGQRLAGGGVSLFAIAATVGAMALAAGATALMTILS